MPSPEAIKDKLMQLSILFYHWEGPSLRMVDRDKKVWEGTEQGGHFHFYGRGSYLWDPETGRQIFAKGYTLSLTGTDKDKERIASDFIAVLGEPRRDFRNEIRRALSKKRSKITYLTWLQPEDDREENKSSYGLLAENVFEAYLLDLMPNDDNPSQQKHNRLSLPE